MYGSVYGMVKTTVYLSEGLKESLRRTAERERRSEADLIREGIQMITELRPPRPRLPLFDSGDPTLSDRFDELMQGFGED